MFRAQAKERQASVKSPTKGELSSAYALLTVENQTKKPGPGAPAEQGSQRVVYGFPAQEKYFMNV